MNPIDSKQEDDDLKPGPPTKEWLTLQDACARKGVSYKTLMNKRYLQPRAGAPDAIVGGRRVWHRSTIKKWLKMTDEEMLPDRDKDER